MSTSCGIISRKAKCQGFESGKSQPYHSQMTKHESSPFQSMHAIIFSTLTRPRRAVQQQMRQIVIVNQTSEDGHNIFVGDQFLERRWAVLLNPWHLNGFVADLRAGMFDYARRRGGGGGVDVHGWLVLLHNIICILLIGVDSGNECNHMDRPILVYFTHNGA